MFQLLYADNRGRMYENPELSAAGRTGAFFTELGPEETILLPEGASLVLIPDGLPVGIEHSGKFTAMFSAEKGKPAFAVGALLPQGYTRTLLPAYKRDGNKPLPLFGYAAVGWQNGAVYVAARRTDDPGKWNPVHYSTPELAALVAEKVELCRDNRIIRQLAHCAEKYNCFTAQNIFYRRWEGGIPVSPACNASCLGCISLQSSECCLSPQERIDFRPSVSEIVELAVPHLAEAEDGIISFGQGCEGEPSLAAETVAQAIAAIRAETAAGTVNMNTNAGYTGGIEKVCRAGIDSLRVSTISAREQTYRSYYCPKDYTWEDVCSSVALARELGVYVSLNLLTFPGLTDVPHEVEALVGFIRKYEVNMVQIRNLNIDPDYLMDRIPHTGGEPLGINRFIEILKEEIPGLQVGNYSKPVEK